MKNNDFVSERYGPCKEKIAIEGIARRKYLF